MTTTFVRNHSHWGAFLAEVEDGRIVGVRPFEHDPDPSPLIEAMPDGGAFADPHRSADGARRLAHRTARVVAKAAAASASCRCRGSRRSIWSRASSSASSATTATPPSWAARRAGRSAGIFHDARAQLRRFLSAFGGFVDQTSNYSFGTALTFLPHVLGSAQAVAGPLTSWSSIARPYRAHGAVRRRQPEEHAGQQGGLRRRTPAAAGSPSSPAPASRSSISARSATTGRRRSSPNGFRSGRTPTPRCCSR